MTWLAAHKLYSEEEFRGRNCRGRSNIPGRTKEALDPNKLLIVKAVCFHYYPLRNQDDITSEWRSCERGIDANVRKLNKKLQLQQDQ